MSSSTPDTPVTRNLLRTLRENILSDMRLLQIFERFTALPKLLSQTSSAWPEYATFSRKTNPPESLSSYFRDSFNSLTTTPERFVATAEDYLKRDLLIHHAIHAALARNSEDLLLQFLVVVAVIHNLGHTIRNSVWAYPSRTTTMEEYPFFCETPTEGVTRAESGFDAEIAVFGGVLGVVFENERPSDATFPFFELDYNRIAYFCLTTPNHVTYKIDAPTIRSRMLSSHWLHAFDLSGLEIIETPPFFQDRFCALLNSTHIARSDAEVQSKYGQTSRSIRLERVVPLPDDYFARIRKTRCGIIRSGGPGRRPQ
ncbi:hypothetical protein C8R46DRAFT_141 [Mycena filopes]|nr:hypothetical protein C8R46DRAFT_141 [Mycena filopes]